MFSGIFQTIPGPGTVVFSRQATSFPFRNPTDRRNPEWFWYNPEWFRYIRTT
ncbi:MAG: hypothetical protein Q4C47_07425 [Planctomycetia bacterium]|nr:hypothetical protein [Planctomycetia bacterium]